MGEKRLPTMIMVMSLGWGAACDEKVEQLGLEEAVVQIPAAATKGRVLLFADLAKEDSSCGCGQIIRLVRSNARQGLSVEEVDGPRQGYVCGLYGVSRGPVVLVIDGDGRESARFEGEGSETIDAVEAALRTLAGRSA